MEAAESSSDSDSDDDEDNNMQTGWEYGWYQPWESRDEPEAKYTRKVPAKYSENGGGDVMVGSMIKTYAVEEKKCDDDDVPDGECWPTGNFFVMKSSAKMAAKEVLSTHMNLTGEEQTAYLNDYFDKAFSHFDVGGAGLLGVNQMPAFFRFLLSDQRIEMGQ